MESKLDELLKQRSGSNENNPNPQNTDTTGNTNTDTQNNQSALDAGSVEDLVQKLLEETRQKDNRNNNLAVADAAVTEAFGEKAGEVVQSKARELGMSMEQLQGIASESPQAFLNLVGATAKAAPGNTTLPSRVNSEALNTNTGGTPAENERWSHFKKMRQENPKEFFKQFANIEAAIDKYGSDTFYNT